METPVETDSEKRIQKRAAKPYDNALVYLQTVDCDKYITEYKDFYKVMTNEPYETYNNLRERLNKEGCYCFFS